MTDRHDRDPTRPGTLFAYGLIGLPLAAATLPLYVHIPNYYAVDLGLGLAAVGTIILVMRLWDVATDPLIGYLSDRIGGRYGRRRLWVGLGLPVAMLGGWLLFRPPEGADLSYLLIAGLILHLGWTMVMLPYQAWGAEMSGDYHARSRISAAREAFVVVGTLVAGGLVAAAATSEDRAQALGWVGLILAVGLPLTALPLFRYVPDPQVPRPAAPLTFRNGARLMAENRPFRRLLVAWILNGIANGLPATLFILFVAQILEQPDRSGLYLLTYFLIAVGGIPVWLWLAKRWGKHRTWCVAMLWACGWFALAPFLGPGDGTLYLVLCLGTGLALGADLALPPSMQADVVDVDTAKSGTARTGLYFALWGMATKLSLALAVGIAFPLLDAAGLDPETPQAAGEAGAFGEMVLSLLYGAVPIAFKLGAIALMWRFPLGEADQKSVRQQVEGAT
jgi:Na+/melibiose symporter-like transporter